jgi:hypothetical protein
MATRSTISGSFSRVCQNGTPRIAQALRRLGWATLDTSESGARHLARLASAECWPAAWLRPGLCCKASPPRCGAPASCLRHFFPGLVPGRRAPPGRLGRPGPAARAWPRRSPRFACEPAARPPVARGGPASCRRRGVVALASVLGPRAAPAVFFDRPCAAPSASPT